MKIDPHEIHQKIADTENGMWLIAADWLQNKCFARGLQYLHVGDTYQMFELMPKPDNVKRIVINLFADRRRTLVSKLTAQQPIPVVSPATSESDDRAVARECESLLSYFWRKRQLQREMDYLGQDSVDCGGGWWKISWDSTAGEEQEVADQVTDLSVAEARTRKVKTGDIDVRFVSNFEMRVDPSATRLDHAGWLARVHYLSTDEIKERWGKTVGADASGTRSLWLGVDWVVNPQRVLANDIAKVIEYWERPNPRNKKGCYVVCTDSEELHRDNELAGGDFPFEYMEFDPDCDNFYGSTPMSMARRAQIEMNNTLSMLADGRNRGAFGSWVQERGAGMDVPTGAPHEVLSFNNNFRQPTFIEPRPVAPQVLEIAQIFDGMISRTSGISESEDATSGRDRLYAAEQDNTKLGPALRSLHAFLKRCAIKMLNCWRDNATFELTYVVGDSNRQSDVRAFSAQKIRFKDVDMSIDSALPLNRQARRDEVMNWMQSGLVDRSEARRLLEFGGTDEVAGSANLDRERARNENSMLYIEPVPVEDYEDHAVHLEEHLSERKQARNYEAAPQIREQFRQHCDMHKYYLQLAMGIQAPAPDGGLTNGASEPTLQTPRGVGQMADVPAAGNSMLPSNAPISQRDNTALGIINGQETT